MLELQSFLFVVLKLNFLVELIVMYIIIENLLLEDKLHCPTDEFYLCLNSLIH